MAFSIESLYHKLSTLALVDAGQGRSTATVTESIETSDTDDSVASVLLSASVSR